MISAVCNYYLTTYGNQAIGKSDTHRNSELKEVYNSMVRSIRKSPLYKIDNTESVQKYAIDLKESARNIKNIAKSMSDTDGSVGGFMKKKADSSNYNMVEAKLLNSFSEDDAASIPELSIVVKNLAKSQVNTGKYLNRKSMDLKQGAYSFDLSVGEYDYEFQFNITGQDTNYGVQQKLARLINRSNIGAHAKVLTNKAGESALRLESDATGLAGYRETIFSISHDENSDAVNAVDYFGLDNITQMPENAHFIVNGLERDTVSNTFNVAGKYEITLKGESKSDDDVTKIGLKPDLDTVIENVEELTGAYNNMLDFAMSKMNGTYESGKLYRDMSFIAKSQKYELDASGFTVDTTGHVSIEESLLIQSANEGTLKDSLARLNMFKEAVVRRADSISINPMNYVDKKLITYPHPTKNFVSPYMTARYSGMMFNAVV